MTRMLALVAALASTTGCKKEPELGPPAQIIDVSTSPAELHTAFNAHRHEARFLTLLSPA